MIWDNILIDLVLIGATYLGWRKYNDVALHWFLWVIVIGLGATIWQHVLTKVFSVPEAVQMGSLFAVLLLRLLLVAMIVLVVIKAFRSTPLSPKNEKLIIAVLCIPAIAFVVYAVGTLLGYQLT